jgi:hypothetical protein
MQTANELVSRLAPVTDSRHRNPSQHSRGSPSRPASSDNVSRADSSDGETESPNNRMKTEAKHIVIIDLRCHLHF